MNEIEIHPEESIEKLLWENKLLSDILLLSRQVPGRGGSERVDLLGLDNDNNIVIIEVKDEEVNEDVILQVMRYAFWVETNPDSIKTLWLEKIDKPEDFDFDWGQKIEIRILIIAPSFNQDVRKLINKINYPVELVELKKFNDGESDFIFLNQLESQEIPTYKPSALRYTGQYDEEFYMSQRNSQSVPIFIKVANMMEEHLKNKGWTLTRSNNKNYISFKLGFPMVCGVEWLGSKSIGIFFKIPKAATDSANLKPYAYKEQWKHAIYKVDSSEIDLNGFDVLFEAAYAYIKG